MSLDSVSAARVTAVFVLFVTAVLVFPAVASAQGTSAQVVGSPEIDVVATENRLQPGTTQTVTLQVTNSGDITRAGPSDLERRVTTARNLRFEIDEDELPEGLELRTGPVVAGSLPEGVGEPLRFTFDISEDVESGIHEIPIRVEYDFTRLAERTAGGITRYRDFSSDTTQEVSLVVEDDARFSISPESSEVIAGDTGSFVVGIENTGTETARNPRIVLSSGEGGVFFGGLQNRLPQRTVGFEELQPGGSTVVSVQAGAESEVTPGSYPIDATVRYDTPGGVTRESRSLTVPLSVGEEQEFTAENIESTLRVGGDGNLRGEIRNEGPQNITDAVVVFEPDNRNINPIETEYAIGSLGIDETAEFDFRVAVSSEAEDGPRQSSVFVEYRNPDGELRTSSAADLNYDVAESIDEFDIESDIRLTEGSSEEIEVDITNAEDETLSNIQAKIFTDDPLSSGDDEAFVSSLEPGESDTLVFELSAASGATAKSYSFSMDFRYDDESDETEVSETYRVPVEVTESEQSSNTPVLLVAVVLLVVVGLIWWKRDALTSVFDRSEE